jgi:serine protease
VDYVNITVNDVATTVNSRGRIGYNQDGQVGGLGFNYMNQGTILYEAGLMIGTSGTKVSDAVRSTAGIDNDFQSVVNVRNALPNTFSDFDVDGKFNDNNSSSPIPVSVHHKAFAWASAGNRKFVIVQYVISNLSTGTLSNLYSGIFADWDIDATTFGSNRASFDAVNKMGYAYYTGANGIYAGIKLLTNTAPVVHYAIDNVSGGAGGVDMFTGGFDTSEKYTTLSTNRPNAGTSGAGADVIDVVSTGPYTIAPGDSITVAFALIAGDDLNDIQTSAANAQIKYDGLTTGIATNSTIESNILTVYPNPASNTSVININIAETSTVSLKIFNILGEEIKTITSGKMQAGAHQIINDISSLSNGIYYYQLLVNDKKHIQKLIVNK